MKEPEDQMYLQDQSKKDGVTRIQGGTCLEYDSTMVTKDTYKCINAAGANDEVVLFRKLINACKSMKQFFSYSIVALILDLRTTHPRIFFGYVLTSASPLTYYLLCRSASYLYACIIYALARIYIPYLTIDSPAR